MMRPFGLPLLVVISTGCGFDAGGHTTAADAAVLSDGRSGGGADGGADSGTDSGVEFRLNVGGVAHTGIDFPGQWAADNGECNGFDGTAVPVSGDVSGTVDDPLFRNFLYSDLSLPMTCSFGSNLPSGDYEVMMLFCEVYHGPGCPGGGGAGSRTFDIAIEGVTKGDPVDPFVDGGGCCHPDSSQPGQPFALTFTESVTDGTVTVDFTPISGTYAMVSAIQVRALAP